VDPKRVPDIRWIDEWARSAGSSLVAPSATTTPTPVSATTSAVPASASVAATATAPSALTWASFVYNDVSAHEILAVEGLDNAGRFFIVVDFNEGEPTRLSSVAVRHQAHARSCCTRLFDPVAYILFGSLEW
jgi:hypothetical protein